MSKAWLLSSVVLLSCTFGLANASAAKPIEVQGHRGARAARPENTLPAFRYALDLGVDTLELDLGVTKDDRLVVLHDQHITPQRCLGLKAPIEVRSLTLAQVGRFDCGSKLNPRFPKQKLVPKTRIPTLEEVFALAKKHPNGKKVQFNIETKIHPAHPKRSPSPKRFAALVVASIRKHGLVQRAVVQSFDHRTLIEVKKLEPKLRIAALNSDDLPDFVNMAQSLGAEIISPHHEWITKEAIEALHRRGVKVIPWTANTPAAWKRLIEMGVDGIITDDPQALLRYLNR